VSHAQRNGQRRGAVPGGTRAQKRTASEPGRRHCLRRAGTYRNWRCRCCLTAPRTAGAGMTGCICSTKACAFHTLIKHRNVQMWLRGNLETRAIEQAKPR
jgi:hypothetical protein